MPRVSFSEVLQRHVTCPPQQVGGGTVRSALEAVFAAHPRLRSYVLDEQGALRRHVVVFVNGQAVADRIGLSDAIGPDADLHVMQALSGG